MTDTDAIRSTNLLETEAPPPHLPDTRFLIRGARRDRLLGTLLRRTLLALAVAGIFIGPMIGRRTEGAVLFVLIAVAWVYLGTRNARVARLVSSAPSLVRGEQFVQAEAYLAEVMSTFSLFGGIKLLGLHHVALLRHAQRRWKDTTDICRALLKERDTTLGPLSRSTRLMLADALIQGDSVADAYPHLAALYATQLSLSETLQLLQVQLDYESRIGAWPSMVRNIRGKVELAEILPSREAARTQAWLALATQKLNHATWTDWLRRRAELLVDPAALVADRPILREVWANLPGTRSDVIA